MLSSKLTLYIYTYTLLIKELITPPPPKKGSILKFKKKF